MLSPEMLASAIRMSIPLLLTANGAIFSERSGVVNIGLEGMMIVGSFWGALGSLYYGPAWGIILGIAAGMTLALIHALASITFRVDQIVSGVALNILAYGFTRFLSILFFKMATTSPHVPKLPALDLAMPEGLKWLEPLTTRVSPVVILALLLVPASWYLINRTTFGLRLRSVGENPLAADTLGINVTGMRYAGVLISGAFAGMAGAYLSVEHTGMYIEGMTQGKGFIALAAMIFGNWSPLGVLGSAALFGFAEALSFRVVREGIAIPYQFIKMIPYLLTVAVLAGVVRKAQPPAAVGVPYERGED